MDLKTLLRLLLFGAIAILVGLVLYFNQMVQTARANEALAEQELETAQERLANVVRINGEQRKTIQDMAATRAANDELMLSLSTSLSKIAANSDLTRSDIRQLERTNAEVRAYLATTLPPELAGVLNRRAAGGDADRVR